MLLGPLYLIYKRAFLGAFLYFMGWWGIVFVLGLLISHDPANKEMWTNIVRVFLLILYRIGLGRQFLRQAYLRRGWIEEA